MKKIKENIKKIISLILITIILSSATPLYVLAQEINENNTTETTNTTQTNEKNKTETEITTKENNSNESENIEEYSTTEMPTNESDSKSGFKLAMRWGGTTNKEYNWNATKNEKRVIKLTVYYQNEVCEKAYSANDITITVPGIGALNRLGTIKATDIAADEYGTTQHKRDWTYKYNQSTDTYTFYNNNEIEQGSTFNGSFELLWEFNSRSSINDYTKTIQATLNDGTQTIQSQELTLNYTSKRDTYYVTKTAKAITSADGLNKYIAPEKSIQDYAWVQYTFRYNVQELNARGLKNRYLTDTLPKGAIIAKDTNVIKNEDGTVTYKIDETSVPENSVQEYSIIVGYPGEQYAGQTIQNTAYLNGTYYDETEETNLAQSTIEVTLQQIQNQTVGIIPRKYMSPDYIYTPALKNDINFSATLYATATTNAENSGYEVAITDDLLEIYTTTYNTLTDDEYTFTSIKVPGYKQFTNANGYALSDGNYTLKLYALYKKDVNTRALTEYTKIYEGKWEEETITQQITEKAVAIRAEVIGLNESIQSFYVQANGTINIAEKVQNGTYENPKYIINYDFTELKDKNGNSLISEIKQENYTQQRLYERDSTIYGTGKLRSQDIIIIKEEEKLGYYRATTDMQQFTIDKNIENFETKLIHGISVNNQYEEEITSIELHGITEREELQTLINTLTLDQTNLSFKNSLPQETDLSEYLKERATITKQNNEIAISFDFSDNPITSKNFTIKYTVDAELNYEQYSNTSNPSYTAITYAYINSNTLVPQSTSTYNGKTMAVERHTESILLALASHQQLIKMVKTQYTEDYVQENAVAPINTQYTYRLKLRNGYNTLVNTEFIDILEHAEQTTVDGTNPYATSEWYGTFKNIDTTYLQSKGITAKVYYAKTTTPDDASWTLMETNENGIWTTTNEVKAIKIKIESEIEENTIIYADINMTAPNDTNLVDKKAYNTYTINSDAIDLYTGVQSTYMKDMPSNATDVRLIEKEYDIEVTKTDAKNGMKISGVQFGLYDTEGNKLRSYTTNILGKTIIANIKEGTYILKEEQVPDGYEKIDGYTITIKDGKYTVKHLKYDDIQYDNITFTAPNLADGTAGWSQNEDGTWQSNNTYIDNNNQNNSTTSTMTSNEFTVTKKGNLSFDWSVSSESVNYDYVYYTITNVETGKTIGGTSTKIGGTSYGTVYDTLKYNSVTTEKLPEGKYTISFTYRKDGSGKAGLDRAFVKNVKLNTKTGVEKTEEEQESVIENNVPKIHLNIENQRLNGSITVYKIDEYLNSSKREIPLSGAVFDLKDTNGKVISTGTTNSSGNIVFDDLEWGNTYILQEKQSLKGYELATQNTYLSKNEKDKTVKIKNIRKKGTVTLTKQDEKDGTKLQGATYGLYANANIYNENGEILYKKDTLIKQAQTDENGVVTFKELIWGSYYLKETRTVYGYDISQTKHEFTISASNVETEVQKTEKEARSKATLQLIKKDNEGNYLEGVEFKIYNKDGTELKLKDAETDEPIFHITNESGRLRIEGIEWGTYYIQEYRPADGYEITTTKFSFTVDRETFKEGNTIYEVLNEDTNEMTKEIINNKKTGKVTLTKYACDSSGNETTNILPNAVYELYLSNGELQGEYTTNENGQITVDNLKWGGYYFQEKQAPTGYSISDKKFSFVINSQNASFEQTVTAYDKQETGELTINKTIKTSSLYSAHGNNTFIFKIIGKDEQNNEKVTLYRTITFTEKDLENVTTDEITKTIKIPEIEPYKYEITEEKTYRYTLNTIIPIKNAEVDGNKGIINLLQSSENKGEITFKNEKTSNSLLTDTGLITNTTQTEYYVIGMSATPKETSYEARTELTKNDFEYKLLYSGGQEQNVEVTGDVTIEGKTTYTQRSAGTYLVNMQIQYNGKTYTVQTQVTFIKTIKLLADVVNIGDYVNYDANSGLVTPLTYTTEESVTGDSTVSTYSSSDTVKWRVLSVDKDSGKVELIAASNLKSLYLEGKEGYINSENILNDIGAIYGKGKGAVGGRSVNIGDIDKFSSYDPYKYDNGYIKYGEIKKCKVGTFVKGEGITGGVEDESDARLVKASSSNLVIVTQTNYGYIISSNNLAYKVLLNRSFWLASRCVDLRAYGCFFNMRFVSDGAIRDTNLFGSNGSSNSSRHGVVPVVSLESDIPVDGKDTSGAWKLKIE